MLTNSQLGELLVEIEVLNDKQLRDTATDVSLDEFLAALAGQPAWWSGPGGQPALSRFQQQQIRKKIGSLNKLRRSLRQKDYIVLSFLGEGGVGEVHKAWDLKRRCEVALKRVHVPNDLARRRLQNEFKAMIRLAGHPAIVPALDLFAVGKSSVLVMEFQNGGDLSARIARGPLEWRRTARWAVELLGGLAAAHDQGLVHRDIKPSNVMIHRTADRELVRLSDWGLVKDLLSGGTVLTAPGNVQGTGHYMPPEQWAGRGIGACSDIYALGCTLYHAVTGRTPFGSPDPQDGANAMTALCLAHLEDPIPSACEINPRVPAVFDAIIRRMMDKEPTSERRGTATGLADDLRRLLRGGHPSPQPRTGSGSVAPPAPRTPPAESRPAPPERDSWPTLSPEPARVPNLGPISTHTAKGVEEPPFAVEYPPEPHNPEPEPAAPARPLTPSERQRELDARVPLATAGGRLLRAFGAWVRDQFSGGAVAEASGKELGHASRTFGVSLRVWFASLLRPAEHPGRVALAAGALAALVVLVWLAVR